MSVADPEVNLVESKDWKSHAATAHHQASNLLDARPLL